MCVYVCAAQVFNVSLHVPSLRVDEIVRVVRSLDVFELKDIPEAVEVGDWMEGGAVLCSYFRQYSPSKMPYGKLHLILDKTLAISIIHGSHVPVHTCI